MTGPLCGILGLETLTEKGLISHDILAFILAQVLYSSPDPFYTEGFNPKLFSYWLYKGTSHIGDIFFSVGVKKFCRKHKKAYKMQTLQNM